MRERVDWLAAAIVGIGVLALTSRRWSAPLLASALGFGLFIGIAFTPALDRVGAVGSQVIALDGQTAAPAETASTNADSSAGGSSAGAGGGAGGSASIESSTSVDETVAPFSPTVIPEPVPVDTASTDVEDVEDNSSSGGGAGGAGGAGDDTGADPDPIGLEGTVVHVNPVAESYTLAVRGELYGIHASKLPESGDRLDVPVRQLANGTYAEDGDRTASGTTERGILNGFVTYVSEDREEPAYTVSARGVSAMVSLPAGETSPELPKLGAFVSVEADITEPQAADVARLRRARRAAAEVAEVADAITADPGSCERAEPGAIVAPREQLIEQQVEPTGEDEFTYFELAGTIQALCPETGELLISADDIRYGGVDLTIAASKDIDLGLLEVDQPVIAAVEVGEDGELSLAGIASDAGLKGADDAEQLQGDFAS